METTLNHQTINFHGVQVTHEPGITRQHIAMCLQSESSCFHLRERQYKSIAKFFLDTTPYDSIYVYFNDEMELKCISLYKYSSLEQQLEAKHEAGFIRELECKITQYTPSEELIPYSFE